MIRLAILRFFESYFRHRWIYLAPIAIMICAAGGFVALSKKEYVSQGTLYVQKASLLSSLTQIQADAFSWRTPTQIALNEINELLQTDAFIRSAIKKTDLEPKMAEGPDTVATTLQDVRSAMQVQLVGDNLIGFSAKTDNPKLSQQLASAMIDAYTQWKLNGDQQESVVAQSFFAQVIPPYQADLQRARDDLKTYLEAHPKPLRGDREPQELAEIAQRQAAIDLASKRLENAQDKEESAKLAQSQAESNVRQNYLVIDTPTLPTKPERSLKSIAISAGIFVILGILLSIAGVVGGALLDRSFRFSIDVRNSLELPILAIIPDVGRLPAEPLAQPQEQPSEQIAPAQTEAAETLAGIVPDQAAV